MTPQDLTSLDKESLIVLVGSRDVAHYLDMSICNNRWGSLRRWKSEMYKVHGSPLGNTE